MSPIKRCVFFVKTLVFVFDYGQVGFVRNVVAYVPIAPFKREWCRLVEVPAFHILTLPIAGTPISNSYFRSYLYPLPYHLPNRHHEQLPSLSWLAYRPLEYLGEN